VGVEEGHDDHWVLIMLVVGSDQSSICVYRISFNVIVTHDMYE